MDENKLRDMLTAELRRHERTQDIARRKIEWTSILAVSITLAGILAALLTFIFLPRVDASEVHQSMKQERAAKLQKLEEDLEGKIDKADAKIEGVKRKFNRLERKIDVIGFKVGAQRELKRIDREVGTEGLEDETEDP